jgi:4-amino-4-deoxy-L-arabinose transferase-like glycosyltransferase
MLNLQSSPNRQLRVFIPSWFVYLITCIFVFAGLGSYSILDNNEGLYAQIAREMLYSGDWRHWVIPHLNTLVYMEKPPLLYWLTAASFAIFGESDWSARLVPACAALGTVHLLLRFGRFVACEQESRLAALMFVSGVGVTVMARTLMFDMLFTVLLTAALTFAYRFTVDGCRGSALRYSLGFLALTVLAKGLVAIVLYAAILVCFMVSLSHSVQDFVRRFREWFDWRAWLVFLVVAAPWHVLAGWVEPFFSWFYFVNEHLLRFFGTREPQDYYSGPWWYYLPRMMLFLFPWSFLLLGMVAVLLIEKLKSAASITNDTGADQTELMKFLSAAWLVPLCFFSLSSAKGNYYLVIVMPFVALQLAILLMRSRFDRVLIRVVPGLVASVVFVLLALNVNRLPAYLVYFSVAGVDARQFLMLSFWTLSVVSLIATWLVRKQPRIGLLWYLTVPLMNLCVCLTLLHSASQLSSSSLMAQRIVTLYPEREVLLYRTFDERSSLPFYLKRPVKTVETGGADLYWGNRLYGGGMILSHKEFAALIKSTQIVLVVLDRDQEDLGAKTYAPQLRRKEAFLGAALYIN